MTQLTNINHRTDVNSATQTRTVCMNLFDLVVEQTVDCDSGQDDETIIADFSDQPK